MRSIACGVVCALLSLGVEGLAQTRTPQTPPVLTIDSLAGKDTFNAYCAPSHGRSGAGDGPLAPVLRAIPADLRGLFSRRGYYLREDIVAFVTGDGWPIAGARRPRSVTSRRSDRSSANFSTDPGTSSRLRARAGDLRGEISRHFQDS
jgi:hypothetical protein